MVDLNLLAPNRVVDRPRAIRTLSSDHDLLGNAGGFVDHRLLGCFGDVDCLLRPVYVLQVPWIGNRAAYHLSVLFVKGDLGFYGLVDDKTPDTCMPSLDDPFPNVYLFLGHS